MTRSGGRARDLLIGAGLALCLTPGVALATDPGAGVGEPGDGFFIPPGYFDPDVPDAGTPEQQAAMIAGIIQIEGVGDLLVADIEMAGQQAVTEVDALTASGATPVELYDAAIAREDMLAALADEHRQTIVDAAGAIFLPIEASGAPPELMAAAFGPVLTPIAEVQHQRDLWSEALRDRRPAMRPAMAIAPPTKSPPDDPATGDEGEDDAVGAIAAAFEPPALDPVDMGGLDAINPRVAQLSNHQRKQLGKVDKKLEKQTQRYHRIADKHGAKVERGRAKLESTRREGLARIADQRARVESVRAVDDRRYQRELRKLERLEQRHERKVAKHQQRLERQQDHAMRTLDRKRAAIERLQRERAMLVGTVPDAL